MYSEPGIAGMDLHLCILHDTPVVAPVSIPHVLKVKLPRLTTHSVVVATASQRLPVLLPDDGDATLRHRRG